MKLTTLFIFALCLHASARINGQQVTLQASNQKLEQVFRQIKAQTGYVFIYNDKDLAKARPVSVDLRDLSITAALDKLLQGQQLTYEIKGNTIFVSAKEEKLPPQTAGGIDQPTIAPAPPVVHGRVTDEKGEPVVGVSISIKGGKIIGVTDNNGEFRLSNVPDDAVLVFSAVTIETIELRLNGRVELALHSNTKVSELEEIIINKGYYTEKQKYSTSNTFTVRSKDIEKQPVNNPLLALVGRIPGLQVEQQTGYANSGVIVRIQGRNSLSSGLDPLFVIDGVPYISQTLPTLQNGGLLGNSGNNNPNSPAGSGNPLSFLNPADIERIDVLKDADATAIYGTRGANGVILITMKKGKSGRTTFSANVQTGFGSVPRKLELLNTQQYLAMRREAKKNDNAAILANDYDINGTWDTTRYTDWQKELLGSHANYTDGQLSVSGGNNNTQILISGGYHYESTVLPGNFGDKKSSLQFNIDHVDQARKFRIQLSGNFVSDNNKIPTVDLAAKAITLSPNAPPLYNSDGSLNWAPVRSGASTVSTWTNPLSFLSNTYRNKVINLIGSAFLSYQVMPGLFVKSNFGYNYFQSDEFSAISINSYRPELRATSSRAGFFGNGNLNSWSIEPQISYGVNLGPGKLESLIGGAFQGTTTKRQEIVGIGYTSDLVVENLAAASSYRINSSLYSEYNYNGVFGRLNYNYSDRYIINFTARRDGSSRFGSSNIFHNFWGAGAAWIFTNEKRLTDVLPFLSFGKLKASYGVSGNDNIGNYIFLSTYSPVSYGVPYQNIPVIEADRLSNPYLQWENTKKLQFGLDIGLWHDRIFANLNYYYNRSSNLITSQSLSNVAGFESINLNFEGIVQNTGWELSLTTQTIKNKQFAWTTSINLTIPQNKLVAFPNLQNSTSANVYTVGRSLFDTKATHFVGIDPATGEFLYSTNQGTTTMSPGIDDQIGFRNLSPRLFGGFQNTISYEGLDLDFTFQFERRDGTAYLMASNLPGNFNGISNVGNQPVYVLNRWQRPGDNAGIARFVSTTSSLASSASEFNSGSDGIIRDASFLRLANLSLSWQFPHAWKKSICVQQARLFVRGQNLFMIADKAFLNPTTGSSASLPPLRVITIGGQITF